MRKVKPLLYVLLERYWFAPGDAFLRAYDARMWKKVKSIRPVLDIGCGDGEISRFIYGDKRVIDVGIDKEERGIKIFFKPSMYRKMLVADVTKMPFKNESFWTIFSNSTFEHIKGDIKAVSEVSRVLKKGGRFFFTVPSKYLPLTLKSFGISGEELEKYNKRVEHFHYRSLSEWRRILSQFSLQVVRSKYYFPDEALKIWYLLFKMAVRKIYHRELWSYLGDSPLKRVFPKRPFVFLLKRYLKRFSDEENIKKGNLLFIEAIKL